MDRYQRLQQAMPAELDGFLVSQAQNRQWLTGFTGSTGIAVVPKTGTPVFMTDFRYTGQAAQQIRGFELVEAGREMMSTDLLAVLKRLGISSLGFEEDHVSVAQHNKLVQALTGIELLGQKDIILDLRSIKDDAELELLTRAVKIADEAFAYILGYLKPGLTERQVALELEHFMQAQGASGASFDIIVASGHRSALPHGVASDKVLAAGEFIKMDLGCFYQGYSSDLTRTVVLGHASARQREIYGIVLEAQLAAIQGIRSGITGAQADALARDLIVQRGYGDNFGHGLGHGIGLACHELPSVNAAGTVPLVPGNVVTVEPGIYIPQWGGVRIEDMIVIEPSGCRVLTGASKELIELV